MSKTAREVLTEQMIGPSPGWQITNTDADAIVEALDAAGFAIVPKHPNKVQEEQIPLGWSTIQLCMVYARMVEAGRVTVERKP